MRNDSQELFEAFERGNRFEKHQALVRMPLHAGVSANSKVRRFLEKMTLCGLGWKDIRLPNGRVVRRRNFCNQPLCPKCRPFVAKRDADRGWQRFVDAIGPDFDASDFSFVSVNGSVIDPSDPRHTRTTSDRRIKRHLMDLGSPVLCYGRYELTRRDDRQLRLDWHFVCYHPGIERDVLATYFRKKFPECRAVNVKSLRGGDSGLSKHIKEVLRYAGKMHIAGEKAKNQTIDDVIELISAYEKIRSTGLKGLRFEYGFRSQVNDDIDQIHIETGISELQFCETGSSRLGLPLHCASMQLNISVSPWSSNHAPYRELIRTKPLILRFLSPDRGIYGKKDAERSVRPLIISQARAPPIRGDPSDRGGMSRNAVVQKTRVVCCDET